jgi:DNA-binding winged helix-turn-helix (wHTH) protein/tetratricopeptide (TPR) repeat protein
MIPGSVRVARFGPFELDLRAGSLRKQDRRIRLQDQPLQVLAALLEHPGEMVTREELRLRLWPADTFVDFNHGLNNAINRLRETLGDAAEKPLYIETIPRRGYRFIAAVESASPLATPETPTELDPAEPTSRTPTMELAPPAAAGWRRVVRPLGFGVASVLLLTVVIVAVVLGGRSRVPSPASGVYRSQPPPSPTVNREALEYFLRAKPYLSLAKPEDNEAAIGLLEKAVALDASFAVAYAALGDAYRIRAFAVEPHNQEWEQKAFAAVQSALRLDPNLAAAYVVRSRLLWAPSNHWAYDRAVQEARRALALDPKLPEAHLQLGDLYNHVGLLDRAGDELRAAVALDPFNTAARFRLGVNLLYQGRYEDSLTAIRDAQRFNPSLWTFQTSFALFQLGRRQEAKERVTEFLRGHPRDPGGLLLGLQALLAAAAGDAATAERSIRDALTKEAGYAHFHHTEYVVAAAYARLGSAALAMKYLERAADNGFPCFAFFERDANLDRLRGEPRFIEFMTRQQKQWEHAKAAM